MEIKEQIKQELIKQKEEKLKKAVEENSKLKEVTLYTSPKHTLCENYKKAFTTMGIKFKEKNIKEHKIVPYTVQINALPIIEVNDNYLVHSRDCNNPQQCIQALKHFAHPDFINPPFERRLIEMLKNISFNVNKNLGNVQRSLQPVMKVLNEISKEESPNNEKKTK